MYEIFEKLLEERGISAYKVSKDTGVTTATLTNWKQGKYIPKQDKLQKIADYFDVSLEYLMTGKEKEFEMYSIENAELLAKIAKNKEAMKIMEYYMKLSEEDKKEIEMMVTYKANKKE